MGFSGAHFWKETGVLLLSLVVAFCLMGVDLFLVGVEILLGMVGLFLVGMVTYSVFSLVSRDSFSCWMLVVV